APTRWERGLGDRARWTPTTSWPSSAIRAAAAAEPPPPDIAASTRSFRLAPMTVPRLPRAPASPGRARWGPCWHPAGRPGRMRIRATVRTKERTRRPGGGHSPVLELVGGEPAGARPARRLRGHRGARRAARPGRGRAPPLADLGGDPGQGRPARPGGERGGRSGAAAARPPVGEGRAARGRVLGVLPLPAGELAAGGGLLRGERADARPRPPGDGAARAARLPARQHHRLPSDLPGPRR